MRPLSALLLVACGPSLGADPAALDTGAAEAGWSSEPPLPTYAVDALDGVVATLMAERVAHPILVGDWFVSTVEPVLGSTVAGCPLDWSEPQGMSGTLYNTWAGVCDDAGVRFHGVWIATVVDRVEGANTYASYDLLYSFDGVRADGSTLVAGGALRASESTDPQGITVFAYVMDGVVSDDGAQGALGGGISTALDWSGSIDADGKLRGSFDGPLGGGGDALEMVGVEVDPACGDGPTGALRLRDPSGAWWELSLADDCSGCGTASWLGEDVGDTCAGQVVQSALVDLFALQEGRR
jgi:hypothetical protein